MLHTARRPLVCLHYGIGDVVMQLPVLQALKMHIPQAAITLLGSEPALELFHEDRRWHSIQSIQTWGLRHWGDVGNKGIQATVDTWIERCAFDLTLDVSHAVLAVKEVIWNRRGNILDTGAYLPAYGMNGVQAIKKSVALKWGLTVPEQMQPRLVLGKQRLRFAERYGLRHWSGKPPVAVSALASSPLKRWPPERLAETAAALSMRFDLPIAIFAGPQSGAAARVAAALKHPRNIVGPSHLLDTAALLSRCAILICNDTGLMHLAAAVGTPVVAVFGPTSESIYLPPSSSCTGVSSSAACPHRKTDLFGPSPCLVENRCLIDRHSCIDNIPMENVLEAAMNLLPYVAKGALKNA